MTDEKNIFEKIQFDSRLAALQYGASSESLVCDYLQKDGYEILEKNYRTRFGEVDLIVKKQSTLVFVEVRARNTKEGEFDPIQMLSSYKLQRVIRASRIYLAKNLREVNAGCENEFQEIRFDFISVLGKRVSSHIKGWQV